MKKQLVLSAAIIASMAMTAQVSVLKDAEHALKAKKSPAEVVTIITPAFSDPETQGQAQTYYIPGKAMFEDYDALYGKKQLNMLPEEGIAQMGNDLLEGYEYYMKALPLDPVTDAKGKVKTKYTKEIINTIAGHFPDYNSAAVDFWNLKDYDKAYQSWGTFLAIAQNPEISAKVNNLPGDTIIGETYFNQALAAWQGDKLDKALEAFDNAKKHSYNKKQLYDYAIAVASQLKNNDAVYAYAQEALPLYGSEDTSYLGYIINQYLQAKDFDKAFAIIDKAIADDPTNAQYYLVKGVLYDNQDNKEKAKEFFKKALELNPENSQAQYNYGRMLCEEAYALSDKAPINLAESEKYYNEKIVPVFKEAATYLERAYELDNDNYDALQYLDNVYYNLHDEAKKADVQERMNR